MSNEFCVKLIYLYFDVSVLSILVVVDRPRMGQIFIAKGWVDIGYDPIGVECHTTQLRYKHLTHSGSITPSKYKKLILQCINFKYRIISALYTVLLDEKVGKND
jgi:hypothetical protein